jgi:SPP1 gp7 family putative phage head morphogenesis protein
MRKKTKNYWIQRTSVDRLIASEKIGASAINQIIPLYKQALKNINKEINSIYVNYSTKTGLDINELSQIINGTEKANFLRNIQAKMISLGFRLDQIQGYNYRLTRLDALKQQIYWEIMTIAPQEITLTGKKYIDIIENTYNNSRYDRARELNIYPTFSIIDKSIVKELLQDTWEGYNYSERVWGNVGILGRRVNAILNGVFNPKQRYKIQQILPEVIGGGLVSGQSYQKTARQLNSLFDVGVYNSTRLVRTESNYFHNQSEAQSAIDEGIKNYGLLETLDNRTSKICRNLALQNKVYLLKERKVGINYPPFHPNCRTTIYMILDSEYKNYKLIGSVKNIGLKSQYKASKLNEEWKAKTAKRMISKERLRQVKTDSKNI